MFRNIAIPFTFTSPSLSDESRKGVPKIFCLYSFPLPSEYDRVVERKIVLILLWLIVHIGVYWSVDLKRGVIGCLSLTAERNTCIFPPQNNPTTFEDLNTQVLHFRISISLRHRL